ncbi:ribonuclease H-like domain-containing protein [Candidatus Woesearchaeota archaeon]|nr:ribonuclease H-like domain-containing protein [Candidatus Woesearchaeota archaeon]
MLRKSFILLDKIGVRKERSIWSQGVGDWRDFLSAGKVNGIGKASKGFYDRQIVRARKALADEDSHYFAAALPASEHWRLFDEFGSEAVYLDIETTGLGFYDSLTVVGLYDGTATKTMIRGVNLDYRRLAEELSKYRMIITFNGASFDLPFLRKYAKIPEVPHLDLRFACKRVGLSGGLKSIERQLGIERANKIIADFNGGDAAELWRLYRATGDSYYLNLLVEYNEEDIVNLERISKLVCSELRLRALGKGLLKTTIL